MHVIAGDGIEAEDVSNVVFVREQGFFFSLFLGGFASFRRGSEGRGERLRGRRKSAGRSLTA